jgi:uncharacterized protein YbbC (DUF1343 family)
LRGLRGKIIQTYQEIPSFASIVGRINMFDWESTMPFQNVGMHFVMSSLFINKINKTYNMTMLMFQD